MKNSKKTNKRITS